MTLTQLLPNIYFNPDWYAKTYGAEFLMGESPEMHYVRRGERENAWPSPHFDPEWYRDQHALADNDSPLLHYLEHRSRGDVSPLPVFDAIDYAKAHPDWRDGAEDPYQHSLGYTHLPEGPRPSWTLGSVFELAGANPETGETPETVSWETLMTVVGLFVPLIPFDENWYRTAYLDVDEGIRSGAIESAHQHFVAFGFFEGRRPRADS